MTLPVLIPVVSLIAVAGVIAIMWLFEPEESDSRHWKPPADPRAGIEPPSGSGEHRRAS